MSHANKVSTRRLMLGLGFFFFKVTFYNYDKHNRINYLIGRFLQPFTKNQSPLQ